MGLYNEHLDSSNFKQEMKMEHVENIFIFGLLAVAAQMLLLIAALFVASRD